VFHNLAVPVLHLFIWIVKFLSLYVDELNDDDDDDDIIWMSLPINQSDIQSA